MGMAYSSAFNLDKLRQNLFAKQGRINKGMRHGAKEAAELIMKKSQDNAPVDTYNLEEAHHLEESMTRADNVRYTIEVSGEGFGSDQPRDVEAYAMLVHELLAPYGAGELNGKPFKLKNSPQNNAKKAEGKDPGGKFMERAIESEKAAAIAIIRASVRKNMFK
jgi:hypothetical protein